MSTYYHGVEYESYALYEEIAAKRLLPNRYLDGILFWTTQKGESINVRDLSDKHIDAILNTRYFKFHETWKKILLFEKTNVRKIIT